MARRATAHQAWAALTLSCLGILAGCALTTRSPSAAAEPDSSAGGANTSAWRFWCSHCAAGDNLGAPVARDQPTGPQFGLYGLRPRRRSAGPVRRVLH